ncbi:MAG: MEKHLA domain-containing protein [Novosphingobium sp.]
MIMPVPGLYHEPDRAVRIALIAQSYARLLGRLSAEAPLREERQALLDRVTANGFIDDYAGIRISAMGRRFRIGPAVVWNLVDAEGYRHGQAACFTP